MKKHLCIIKKTVVILMLTSLVTKASAEVLWNLREISYSNNPGVKLTLPDQQPFSVVNTNQARELVKITDKFSLLSGIYPKLYLNANSDLNAYSTYKNGEPIIVINKGMYDVIVRDNSEAAALIGHEMSHLYFHHLQGQQTTNQVAAVIGFFIGTALDIFLGNKIGIVGIGSNVGDLLSAGISTSYSRENEREADKQGIIWALQTGYDPSGATKLFETMKRAGGGSGSVFFNTHPNVSERIDKSQEIAELFHKYKSIDLVISPKLQALNKKIDEDYSRQLPTSQDGQEGVIAFDNKDFSTAKLKFEKCAANGEIACLNNLGVLYQFGLGIQEDKKKAAELYLAAADKGSGLALMNYATSLQNSGNSDVFRLLKLERQAAERGSPKAMGTLAASIAMQVNSGLPQEWIDKTLVDSPSKEEIFDYANAAAIRGSRDGQYALGVLNYLGYGTSKNINRAELYLAKASDRRDIRATALLIYLYENELANSAKAEALKAMYQGNPKALGYINLVNGLLYCNPRNNLSQHTKCQQIATQLRSSPSGAGAVLYGYTLSQGVGMQRNLIEGSAWLLNGKNSTVWQFAKWQYERNISTLSDSEIEQIKTRAAEIRASYFKESSQ